MDSHTIEVNVAHLWNDTADNNEIRCYVNYDDALLDNEYQLTSSLFIEDDQWENKIEEYEQVLISRCVASFLQKHAIRTIHNYDLSILINKKYLNSSEISTYVSIINVVSQLA
jgi:hypothetical protein